MSQLLTFSAESLSGGKKAPLALPPAPCIMMHKGVGCPCWYVEGMYTSPSLLAPVPRGSRPVAGAAVPACGVIAGRALSLPCE